MDATGGAGIAFQRIQAACKCFFHPVKRNLPRKMKRAHQMRHLFGNGWLLNRLEIIAGTVFITVFACIHDMGKYLTCHRQAVAAILLPVDEVLLQPSVVQRQLGRQSLCGFQYQGLVAEAAVNRLAYGFVRTGRLCCCIRAEQARGRGGDAHVLHEFGKLKLVVQALQYRKIWA